MGNFGELSGSNCLTRRWISMESITVAHNQSTGAAKPGEAAGYRIEASQKGGNCKTVDQVKATFKITNFNVP